MLMGRYRRACWCVFPWFPAPVVLRCVKGEVELRKVIAAVASWKMRFGSCVVQ
jgi:hypothetical protein